MIVPIIKNGALHKRRTRYHCGNLSHTCHTAHETTDLLEQQIPDLTKFGCQRSAKIIRFLLLKFCGIKGLSE